jgi:geranylgeranyl pyrophosphate synthase
MDLHVTIADQLLSLPAARIWPEIQAVIQSVALQKPRDWHLPVIACEAVGGGHEQAVPVAAAVASLQISIVLIDAMLDADPKGWHHTLGLPMTANLAAAFQAAALEMTNRSTSLSATARVAIFSALNQAALSTACGQYLDCLNPDDEEIYWQLVAMKSASYFGTAFEVGALAAGSSADGALVDGLRRFGCLYGEMIQIEDDLSDTMARPAGPDWLLKRSPLPILFARVVSHTERCRFLELCDRISDEAALAEAQALLVRCGAVSYCVDQLLRRYHQAQQLLDRLPLSHTAELERLMADMIRPAEELMALVDA